LVSRNKKTSVLNTPEAAGNEFGTAEWATLEEVEKTTTEAYFDEPVQKGGVLLGTDLKEGLSYLETNDTHTNIIGSTRSGKSRKLVLPSIYYLAKANESMILTDPKGELYLKTKEFLKSEGYV